jgi:HlyD family secretion protein
MKKIVLTLSALSLLAVVGAVAWEKYASANTNKTADTETATVARGLIKKTVQCTGTAVSNLDVEIKCKVSGLVTKMPFDISDHAKKDDLLLEIDPVDQLRAVQQAEATLAASKAQVAQAEDNLAVSESNLVSERKRTEAVKKSAVVKLKDSEAKAKREKELLARKQSTVEEAETAQTTADQAVQDVQTADAQVDATRTIEHEVTMRKHAIDLAKAQMQNDDIALSLAKQHLGETKVYAPIDGVVSARTVQEGQIIASGINNVGGGTSVITLSDLSRIFVLASVDESDIGSVTLDQRVDITADAFPGEAFSGKVVRIATTGVNTSNVVTFEVRVEVLSENKSKLKPKMTANVEIVVAEKTDALNLPLRAISRKGGKAFVSLPQPDGTVREGAPIETGITNGSEIEIVSGLAENDVVVFKENAAEGVWRNKKKQDGPPMMMGGPPPPRGK